MLTFALKQIKPYLQELKDERREALENYDDELFDNLVLQTVMLEQKSVGVFKDIVV